MEASQAQAEIARLEPEAKELGEYFAVLMGNLPTGESDIEEVVKAFRAWGTLQIDINELRLRAVADTLQSVGIGGLNSLNLNIPTIG